MFLSAKCSFSTRKRLKFCKNIMSDVKKLPLHFYKFHCHLTSTLPKNQAAPIEKVISDLFRIPKMYGTIVSLCHKSPKAKGKL